MSGENPFFETTNLTDSPVILEECLGPAQNKIFRETIDKFHSYVKYKDCPTRRINWLVYESESGNQIGAVGLSSATIAVKVRDEFIGWDNAIKMKNLCQLANNYRFCLAKKRTTIENSATLTLKQLRIQGALRWKAKYGDDLLLLETFVQPGRDRKYDGHKNRNGACYKADNWLYLGETQGNHIRKSPLGLWAREKNSERGKLARENPKECLKKFSDYLGECNSAGYQITKVAKKIMFVKPLVWNWKEKLLR